MREYRASLEIFLSVRVPPHGYAGREEENCAGGQAAGDDEQQGLSVVPDEGGEGLDDDGEVAAHVVHDEEEEADAGGVHGHGRDLHDDREEYGEPRLGAEVVAEQAQKSVRGLQGDENVNLEMLNL